MADNGMKKTAKTFRNISRVCGALFAVSSLKAKKEYKQKQKVLETQKKCQEFLAEDNLRKEIDNKYKFSMRDINE